MIAVGTASGRVLYVGTEGGHHVSLRDTATAHSGYTMLSSQARELGEVLISAADAIEGHAVQPAIEKLSE